jgi:hypothetical protein
MRRRGRTVIGSIGGILWGAGVAVLIQQYGLWPLDPALAYGAPLAGAVISGGFGRVRARSNGEGATAIAAIVLPILVVAFQTGGCDVIVHSSGGDSLAASSPSEPVPVDPETQPTIVVEIVGDGIDGRNGELWIEVGGIPVLSRSGIARGGLEREFNLWDNGLAGFGGAPGIYHVGGSIDDVCDVDGYVRVAGNPLTGPVGLGGVGAIGIGLLLSAIAVRPGGRPSGAGGSRGDLRPNGKPVQVGNIEIRSPSLDGEVEVHQPSESATRSVARWSEETRQALELQHVAAEHIIEITNTVESPSPAIGRELFTHHAEPAFQVDLPNPGAGHGQVILASNESGVVRWHFPRLGTGGIDAMRTAATTTYRIGRDVARTEPPERRRGVAEAFGTKVLSSLVFPLLDPVFERVGERYARVWEAKRRPYRLRTFTPDDYDLETAAEPDWDRMVGGKALLFVHGTFSRAHTGFGALSVDVLDDLHRFYGGRIFAFDHFTLSHDPKRNVSWFLDHLPPGIELDLDIVCHSRGGLVSRVLAEKQPEMDTGGRRVDVDKIVFVASPNAGTVLAEPTYVGDYIDTYTNLANFIPGSQVVDVLEGVITVVKHMAVGAVSGLDGLRAMRPGGEFLAWLNTTSTNPSQYYAVAGDYEPANPGWRSFAKNRLMDQIFREANDLVVPTSGTFGSNGSSHFPIAIRHEFSGDQGVDHTGYFGNKSVRERLLEWLGA